MFKWNGEFGPAAIGIGLQTIAGIIAITMIYAQLSNTAASTKDQADKLAVIVDRMQQTQVPFAERLVKVETILNIQTNTLGRIEMKVDAFKR